MTEVQTAQRTEETGHRSWYQCPGEKHPISESVHRARLAAGWVGCDTCRHRENGSRPGSLSAPDTAIHRTPWGVRGTWHNAMTRTVAARLAAAVVAHLRDQAERNRPEDRQAPDGSDLPLRSAGHLRLVVGFDGRPASPDIFCGIVDGARRNGADVMDAGRTTAAAIQEICRSTAGVAAGLIVTGAGWHSAAVGFDLFDCSGAPVSVPWTDENLAVPPAGGSRRRFEPRPADRKAAVAAAVDRISAAVTSLEELPDSLSDVSGPLCPGDPPTAARFRRHRSAFRLTGSFGRSSRRSGKAECIQGESIYRRHLQRWIPEASSGLFTCLCVDSLTRDRAEWIAAEQGLVADVVLQEPSTQLTQNLQQRTLAAGSAWGIALEEDDRFARVVNRYGRPVPSETLVRWINDRAGDILPHVTAHVPGDEDRVVLLDAARPGHPGAHESISDGFALLGCICRLVDAGIPLPHDSSVSSGPPSPTIRPT